MEVSPEVEGKKLRLPNNFWAQERAMVTKSMALFVFGAGATRGASFVDPRRSCCIPPLDYDFFTQLQRISSAKHQALVAKVMRDVIELFGTNFASSMETVFSTLDQTIRMVKATRESREFKLTELKAKRDRLIQAIAAVLEESMSEHSTGGLSRDPQTCNYHRTFVEKHLQPRDAILSFNYDCLLDFTLKEAGSHKWNARYGYGFNLGPWARLLEGYEFWQPKDPSPKPETVKFFKLHGSLHFNVDDVENAKSQIRLKQRPYTKQYGSSLKFTILPPEAQKAYSEGVFGPLWAKASQEINSAGTVVVIGYSLPTTDLHASTLFRTSVRAQHLRSLIVINPDREARKRTRTVFQRGISPDTKVLSFDHFAEFLACDRSVWDL